jgi:hypothetical protein
MVHSLGSFSQRILAAVTKPVAYLYLYMTLSLCSFCDVTFVISDDELHHENCDVLIRYRSSLSSALETRGGGGSSCLGIKVAPSWCHDFICSMEQRIFAADLGFGDTSSKLGQGNDYPDGVYVVFLIPHRKISR